MNLFSWIKQKQDVKEIVEEKGRKLERILSYLLGYHSFYGKFSIFLFLSSILFFIALTLGKREFLSNMHFVYYILTGTTSILIFNFIKLANILGRKGGEEEEVIYVLDILQTITVNVLLYSFVNIAVDNNIYSLFRSMLLILTFIILFLSYLARKGILFRIIIFQVYRTDVVISQEHAEGSDEVIIMDQEVINKVNYYTSYMLFLWYLLSFSLTFVSHAFYGWKILLYIYLVPFILLVFAYSFIYNYFRGQAM